MYGSAPQHKKCGMKEVVGFFFSAVKNSLPGVSPRNGGEVYSLQQRGGENARVDLCSGGICVFTSYGAWQGQGLQHGIGVISAARDVTGTSGTAVQEMSGLQAAKTFLRQSNNAPRKVNPRWSAK